VSFGGFVRVMSLERPDDIKVIFFGHGRFAGTAYLNA
jgi:hypothetical protein